MVRACFSSLFYIATWHCFQFSVLGLFITMASMLFMWVVWGNEQNRRSETEKEEAKPKQRCLFVVPMTIKNNNVTEKVKKGWLGGCISDEVLYVGRMLREWGQPCFGHPHETETRTPKTMYCLSKRKCHAASACRTLPTCRSKRHESQPDAGQTANISHTPTQYAAPGH